MDRPSVLVQDWFIHSLIHSLFIDHVLCAKPYPGYQEYKYEWIPVPSLRSWWGHIASQWETWTWIQMSPTQPTLFPSSGSFMGMCEWVFWLWLEIVRRSPFSRGSGASDLWRHWPTAASVCLGNSVASSVGREEAEERGGVLSEDGLGHTDGWGWACSPTILVCNCCCKSYKLGGSKQQK